MKLLYAKLKTFVMTDTFKMTYYLPRGNMYEAKKEN